MSNQKLWYGFLEAGNKSSPIVRDSSIEPGAPDTLYLYNLKAGQILRYKASIVESKLRELKPAEEKEFVAELESGFKKVRKDFKIPSAAGLFSATTKISSKKAAAKAAKSEDDVVGGFEGDDIEIDIDTEMIDADSEIADDDDESEIADDE